MFIFLKNEIITLIKTLGLDSKAHIKKLQNTFDDSINDTRRALFYYNNNKKLWNMPLILFYIILWCIMPTVGSIMVEPIIFLLIDIPKVILTFIINLIKFFKNYTTTIITTIFKFKKDFFKFAQSKINPKQ